MADNWYYRVFRDANGVLCVVTIRPSLAALYTDLDYATDERFDTLESAMEWVRAQKPSSVDWRLFVDWLVNEAWKR